MDWLGRLRFTGACGWIDFFVRFFRKVLASVAVGR